jgi:hypothetical protein
VENESWQAQESTWGDLSLLSLGSIDSVSISMICVIEELFYYFAGGYFGSLKIRLYLLFLPKGVRSILALTAISLEPFLDLHSLSNKYLKNTCTL